MSSASYVRPATRGELRDRLREGVSCEVAEVVAEMTSSMLRSWLNFAAFRVRKSENEGWTVFEPVTRKEPGDAGT